MDLPAMKRWQVFKLSSHPRWDRSSPPDVFLGKGNLKIFSKFCRTPIPKCDFDKVALQFYWNQSSGWVLSCKFLQVFRTPFKKSTSEELLLMRSVFLQSPGVFAKFTGKHLCQSLSFNKSDCDCDFSVEVPWISLIQAMDDIEFDFALELQCLSAECQ